MFCATRGHPPAVDEITGHGQPYTKNREGRARSDVDPVQVASERGAAPDTFNPGLPNRGTKPQYLLHVFDAPSLTYGVKRVCASPR